jgi:adenylate cyclase
LARYRLPENCTGKWRCEIGKKIRMRANRRIYQVHAELIDRSSTPPDATNGVVEKLFRRHTARVERAIVAFSGMVVSRLPQGLLASFETAEHAVLCSCEMQRSCGVIPQLSGSDISLRIGIHLPPPASRSTSRTTDFSAIHASVIARMLGSTGIAVSEKVLDALPASLREHATLIDKATIPMHLIDWASPSMLDILKSGPTQSPKIPPKPASSQIKLRQGGKLLPLSRTHSVITVGRSLGSHVVIDTPKASRNHCRIVCRPDACVLVDLSTNGTYITKQDGTTVMAKNNMRLLSGKGWISFGDPYLQDGVNFIEFEIETSLP